jgi:hypothetical protein
MKNTVKFLAFLLLVINFNSCESDDSDDINFDDGTTSEINLEDIYGKWMVSNSTIYKSFEFTDKGVCIMVEKSMAKSMAKSADGEKVSLGTYAWDNLGLGFMLLFKNGERNIILDEILLAPKSASFKITDSDNQNNDVTVQSDRAEEMKESARTELLTNSWLVVSSTIIDEEGIAWTFQLLEDDIRMMFALTDYGFFTSLLKLPIDEGVQIQGERNNGNWRWNDDTEAGFLAWTNEQLSSKGTLFTISSLTENSLVFSFINGDGLQVSYNCITEPTGLFW